MRFDGCGWDFILVGFDGIGGLSLAAAAVGLDRPAGTRVLGPRGGLTTGSPEERLGADLGNNQNGQKQNLKKKIIIKN